MQGSPEIRSDVGGRIGRDRLDLAWLFGALQKIQSKPDQSMCAYKVELGGSYIID
jgi:hypothetical protein